MERVSHANDNYKHSRDRETLPEKGKNSQRKCQKEITKNINRKTEENGRSYVIGKYNGKWEGDKGKSSQSRMNC